MVVTFSLRRRAVISARFMMVPELPYAWSNPCSATRRTAWFAAPRTWSSIAENLFLLTFPDSPAGNISATRIAPSFRLSSMKYSLLSPTLISVVPPPMSMNNPLFVPRSAPLATPRYIKRASSTPLTTRTSTPHSDSARSTNSARF